MPRRNLGFPGAGRSKRNKTGERRALNLILLYCVKVFAFDLKQSGMPLKGFIQGSEIRYVCKIILPVGKLILSNNCAVFHFIDMS